MKAIPAIKSNKERYMGFRENRKGPSLTIASVSFAGSNGVLFLIITIKALMTKTAEANKNKLPALIRAARDIPGIRNGNIYSSINPIPRQMKKRSSGGMSLPALSFGWFCILLPPFLER